MSSNDISLSAAIRTSLISLQGTQQQINTTQNALSTGLAVNNAVDNPVAYFQSQALTDRASDFSEKKSNIDQGISSLSTALEGINGVESLVQQLKGLTLNAESSTQAQVSGLVSQYNSLRGQLNTLATDASYQGLNLIAGTGQTLSVSFSTLTASNLSVQSVDVTSGPKGLSISAAVSANGGFAVDYYSNTGISLSDLSAQTFLYAATAANLTAGIYTFGYGSATLSIAVASAGSVTGSFTTTSQVVDGQVLTLAFLGTGAVNSALQNGNSIAVEYGSGETIVDVSSTLVVDFNALTGSYLNSGIYTFSYAGQIVSFTVGSAGVTGGVTFSSTQSFVNGAAVTLTVGPGVYSAASLSAANVVVANFAGHVANGNSLAVTNPGTNAIINSGGTFVIQFQGLTGVGLNSGAYSFNYGGQVLDFQVASAGSLSGTFTTSAAFFNGENVTLTLGSANAGVNSGAGINTVGFETAGGVGSATLGGSRQNATDFVVEYAATSAAVIATGNTIVVDFNGLTGNAFAQGSYTFSYGGEVLTFTVGSALSTCATFTTASTFSNGLPITLTLGTDTSNLAANTLGGATNQHVTLTNLPAQTIGLPANNLSGYTLFTPGQSIYSNTAGALGVTVASGGTISVAQVTGQFVIDPSLNNGISALLNSLENALSNLRSQAQTVGSNVALLNTRLDFTTNYINLLDAGSGKLTLADLNQEGANLLSLQTSQQLGIQALSFAGQNEKAVLQLFR